MRDILTALLTACIILLPAVSKGSMKVRSYTPVIHDRFYSGVNKAFIGAAYDFSGVGISSSGHWATLVSKNSFISAYHAHPGTGETVTFQPSNVRTTGYQYTITGGTRIGTTDLWVGWFDNAVTVDSSIERYPVLVLPAADNYYGLELYNYGMSDRVGRNVLEALGLLTLNQSTGVVAWYDYDNNDDPSVGGDETLLQAGDSGAPSFAVVNSSLVLVGTHWAVASNPAGSFDTFIPEYYDEVNSVLAGRGQSMISMSVPEPTLLLYFLVSLIALRFYRLPDFL